MGPLLHHDHRCRLALHQARDALEDVVRGTRREPHGRLVEHEQPGAGHHPRAPPPASAAGRPRARRRRGRACRPAPGRSRTRARGARRAGSAQPLRWLPSRRLSATVIDAKIIRPCGTCTMPSSTRLCGAWASRSWPSKLIEPESGTTVPLMAFSKVVLPAPLGPRMATCSRGPTRKSTDLSAGMPS